MNFIGIDLGTSSVKIIIMSEKGKVIDSITKEYPVSYIKQGYAEQNPEDWYSGVIDGLRELIKRQELEASTIKGISFSGQMHGLVILDKDNNVIRPAILWCDQRTEKECTYLNEIIGQEKISKYTGNKALTGFTAPKLLWLKENEEENFNKIKHILLPKDYIRYRLSGDFATDVSDASGTLFFDVENRTWSKEMIEILNIKEEMLPKIYESSEVTGRLTEEVSKYIGLSSETLIIAGAGDQAAGAVGTGTVSSGLISIALGTSGVVFASSDNYSVDKENSLHSFCHSNNKYHFMGVILSAAASLKWWVEEVNKGSSDDYNIMLNDAEKSEAGSSGVVFLPYLMGERTPHNDANAKGVFFGLGITTSKGDMTRAVLEGVAFALRDSLEIMKQLNIPMNTARVNGGGARSRLWLQVLADVLNIKVEIINSKEGPAYGAAILAATGCKVFESVDEACKKLIKPIETIMPIAKNVMKYNKVYNVYKTLYPSLKECYKMLNI